MTVTQMNELRPLVSVVMPAYKAHYLEEALQSLRRQTYRPLELVVCDDCRGDEVRLVVERFAQEVDFPVHYQHNEKRLNEMRNLARCIGLAQGEYIKPLYDDDLLQPECIASLLAVLQNDPSVVLASSRRRRIDSEGQCLPDILATAYPFAGDVLINGAQLVSFLAEYTINFIGEPSTIMCRRADLLPMGDQLSVLGGKRILWVGDLALYVKLLRQGMLAMLAEPLTDFRVSSEQFSQVGRDRPGIGEQGHADFRQAIRELGWYRENQDNCSVQVAPITRLQARLFKPIDLLSAIQHAGSHGGVSLTDWLGARRPSDVQLRLISERLAQHAGGPLIGLMLLDHKGDPEAVERTLRSLEGTNLYRNLSIQVFSPLPLSALAGRVEVVPLTLGGLAESLNTAMIASRADWSLVAEAGCEFTVSGLLVAALDLLSAPETCLAVYADELMRHDAGEQGLALRPDLNLDLLLSFPASLSRHWLLRREALLAQGGFASDCGAAFELEYQLRLVLQHGLACIGHISEPLLSSDSLSLRDDPQEQAVIERHLRERGYERARVESRLPGRYELDYGHSQQGSVSILIFVEGRLAQLQRCLEALLENTDYPHYEVLLLDHGNQASDVRDWLAAVSAMGTEQLRVLHCDASLGRSVLCNQAANQARGDFLLWLDGTACVLDKGWLQRLLNHGLRPEVGAVGAKLLSADGSVRHAGLLLGLCGPVGCAFEGASLEEAGYMQRLQVEQNYSALSGECLMLRKALFIEAGGFDESPLLQRWVDVDLCLKLQQAGYLNVWTPKVRVLVGTEGVAGTASHAEEDALYARWLPLLARDPAYNANLSLRVWGGFELADSALCWNPLQSWKPLPTILAHMADSYGCGHYRIIQPLHALSRAGLVEGVLAGNLLSLPELERLAPDSIVLQRQVSEAQIESIRRIQVFSAAFKVFELDDYMPNLPLKSVHRAQMPKDVVRSLRRVLSHVDRFVVSTQALAEAFEGFHPDIRVVLNRLEPQQWGALQSRCGVAIRPRVGWAGGYGHTGDLQLIADVVKALAGEVDWVFFGMCPDAIRPYVSEFHPGVDIALYPAALAALDLDLALAPVEQNLFNECKSNLRLLEYGACGVPVICSDVRCYQGDGLPVTRVKNRFKDWQDAIRTHLADPAASARQGGELQAAVRRDWMLEGDNLQHWRRAWLPG